MAQMQQPTRGRNAWQDPSSAQPGFDAFKASAPSSQPSWQNPATAQPGWDAYKGAWAPQPAPQPNMSAYGQPSFRRDETVYSPFGNFQNLGQYQQQQDAFVQQFLQSQNQYNQGLNQGQDMAPVQLGDAWRQAGENIANGTYQGNPFATGNVQALMGMFDQYGIPAPAGFQDQLIDMIGQQSPPSMYQPPQRPMTGFPIGPQGEYWPGGPGPQPTAPAQGQVWKGGTPYFDERTGQQSPPPMYQPPSQMPRMPSIEAPATDNRKVVFGPQFGEGLTASEYEAWKINEQARADKLRANKAAEEARKPPPITPEENRRLKSALAEMFAPGSDKLQPPRSPESIYSGPNTPISRREQQALNQDKRQQIRDYAASRRQFRKENGRNPSPKELLEMAPPRPIGSAMPSPERSTGTAYVPPSQRNDQKSTPRRRR